MLFSGDGVNFLGGGRGKMWDGKGRPQAGSCPTQGGLMPVKDGAQPAFIFTAVPAAGWDGWCRGPWRAQPFRLRRKPRASLADPPFPHPAGMGKGAAAAPGAGSFDILDLAFEGIAGLFPDDALHFGDKLPHISGGGAPPVDDEAGMLLADLGPADGKALKPALIHQGGGIVAYRPLKGGAALPYSRGCFSRRRDM